jgi:hypothetical protein
LEYPLDDFGADAWDLIGKGATFNELTADLASRRQEARYHIRGRLREWLGELLVLGLVRRGQGDTGAAERA